MLEAIALAPIWDETKGKEGEIIQEGKRFKMSNDKIMSLVNTNPPQAELATEEIQAQNQSSITTPKAV